MKIDSNPSCQPIQLFKEPLAIVIISRNEKKGESGENRKGQTIKCIPLSKKSNLILYLHTGFKICRTILFISGSVR